MLLSIGMMVKDEEKYLERCLEALRPILDAISSELIIVDTGSQDRTVEIAKKYTDKVYFHKWNNNFGEMRNTVLKYAKGEWFFFLDADEIIDDYQDIIDFFKTDRHRKANAAFFMLKNLAIENDERNYGYNYALRFFRRDKDFHFKGAVHEQPVFKMPVAQIKASAIHYGYVKDDSRLMEYKYKRNVEILKQELKKDPDNLYYWFQLAQSYGMYGDIDKSHDAILKAYNLMKVQKKYLMYVAAFMAKSYFTKKMYRQAIEVAEETCKVKDGHVDLLYYIAVSHYELGNYRLALKKFERYLTAVEKFKKNEGLIDLSISYVTVDLYERALHLICVIHKKLHDYDSALEYTKKIKDETIYNSTIPHVVEMLIEQNKLRELKDLFQEKVAINELFTDAFLWAIEQKRVYLDSERKNMLARLFADDNTDYGLLNCVRLLGEESPVPEELLSRIDALDWKQLPEFYADILLVLINNGHSLVSYLKKMPGFKIMSYFKYLFDLQRRPFTQTLHSYISQQDANQDHSDNDWLRVKVHLLQCILLNGTLTDSDYEKLFNAYIDSGVRYIKLTYDEEIINSCKVEWVKTSSDAFLLYMAKALQQLEDDKAAYVRYLREALKCDNNMKKGIEMLLSNFQEKLKESKQKADEAADELAELKQRLLESLEEHVNYGKIDVAKQLIAQYEGLVGTDAELESIKSVVLVIEQRYDEAENLLHQALKKFGDNYDLLYNLIYVQEQAAGAAESGLYVRLDKVLGTKRAIHPGLEESFFNQLNDLRIRYVVLNPLGDEFLSQDNIRGTHLLVHPEDKVKISKFFVPYGYPGASKTVWVHTIRDLEEQIWGLKLPYEIEQNFWRKRKQASEGAYYIDKDTVHLLTKDAKQINDSVFRDPICLQNSLLRLIHKPKITLDTLAYYGKEYIEPCMESVINQTFTDFEWLVLDNGDNIEISKEWIALALRDYRVKLFKNEVNLVEYPDSPNPFYATYLIELDSIYYCTLDCDDYLHHDFMKKLYALAVKHDADIVISGTEMFHDEDPSKTGKRCPPDFIKRAEQLGDIFPEIYGVFRPRWGKLIKSNIVKTQLKRDLDSPPPFGTGRDTWFCLNCLRESTTVVGVSDVLHYYRIHSNSDYHSRVPADKYVGYLYLYEQAIDLLRAWRKLTPRNFQFLGQVLKNSLLDCFKIAIASKKGSVEERRKLVNNILEDKALCEILIHHELWDDIKHQGLDALSKIQ